MFSDELTSTVDAGDTETENAVALLPDAVDVLANEPNADVLDSQQGPIDGIQALAIRCNAVGSSALQ